MAYLRGEALVEGSDRLPKLVLQILAELTLLVDGLKEILLVALEVRLEVLLPLGNLGNRDAIEQTVDTSEDKRNHFANGHGGVLLLLEQLNETLATAQSRLGGCIEIRTKLGKSSDLTVLGQEEFQGTSNLFHGLDLSSGADTRDRQSDVDSRAYTFVEQFGLQEDLAVSDGDDVSGNVGRHITTLGLNDGESSERTTTVLVVQLSGTLEETRVEVEDITGVSLTTRGTAEQERHLTVGHSLLGQIIVDDDGVLAVVTEPFTHSTASEGSNVLKGSGLRGSSGNDDRVLQGVILLKSLDELSNSGTLLTDGNVDTVQFLGLIIGVVPALLVEDGVKSDGSLTGLTIADNQLTLTTTDGHHGVDRFKTSLHRLVDGATGQDTGSLELGTALLRGLDGTLAIDGVTQGINNTTKQLRADRNIDLITVSELEK